MHSAILLLVLGVAASTFALPLNATDSQVPTTVTGLPKGISAYANSGTGFLALGETGTGPADIESPSSVDPPSSSDPPASSDISASSDPPASTSSDPPVSLSSSLLSPPTQLSGGAALSQSAFKRKPRKEYRLRARYEAYTHG